MADAARRQRAGGRLELPALLQYQDPGRVWSLFDLRLQTVAADGLDDVVRADPAAAGPSPIGLHPAHVAKVLDQRVAKLIGVGAGSGDPRSPAVLIRIDDVGRTQLERDFSPVSNWLDDDDPRGPFDLRALNRREADRAGSEDHDVRRGFDRAIR